MSHKPITLVVSIDGVAPRHISPESMPNLVNAGRAGASCYSAQTILPSLTLPAHSSLFYSVEAQDHGVHDNTPMAVKTSAPSFLKQARACGLSTAMFFNWEPFEHILERDAAEAKYLINGGYCETEDDRITKATVGSLKARDHDLVFSYLARGDLAGHDHGWDSAEYLSAISKADGCLGQMIDALAPEDSLVVTTDHGGLGHHHEQGRPEDLRTFVVIKSPKVSAASYWQNASILDIAPSVAKLADFDPSPHWHGQNLLGQERPLVDQLWQLLLDSDQHQYGEDVTMLEHALQAAQLAKQEGADDSMVLAALLHDVGHLMGKAGEWGYPDHAHAAGDQLQQILNSCISQPIQHHVAAKRYLVSTDSDYKTQLSTASIATLEQQGGLLDSVEIREFQALPFSHEAIKLRQWDDQGKVVGKAITPLQDYRELLASALKSPVFDPRWLRASCICEQCKDPGTGQRLLHETDLNGWQLVSENYCENKTVLLRRESSETHRCYIPVEKETSKRPPKQLWGVEHAHSLRAEVVSANSDLSRCTQQLVENGICLVNEVALHEGAVLEFAKRLGFVRETNYGTLFEVKAVPDPNNLAYTPIGLPLHTDNPYRHPSPGVQLLHCLQNASEGGASQFADGFHAAERLRASHPWAFDVLASHPVMFRFQDRSTVLESEKTILELDQHGQVRAVYLNHRSMQPATASSNAVKQFHQALELFVQQLTSKDSAIEITLQAGELIVFDNSRVLHGRKAYHISEPRHLQGCYIDMDAVYSDYALAQG